MLGSYFQYVILSSILHVPIILFFILFFPWARKKYKPFMNRMLWLLLCFNLVIPFSFTNYIVNDLQKIMVHKDKLITIENKNITYANQKVFDHLHNVKMAKLEINLVSIMCFIWVLGFLFLICKILYKHIKTIWFLKRQSVLVVDKESNFIFNKIKAKLNIRRDIKLMKSSYIATPILIGFINPTIVIPMPETDTMILEQVITHEMTHYKNMDLYYKLIAILAVTIHWFNPFAWKILREVESDIELYCDYCIIKHSNSEARKLYGYSILKYIFVEETKNSISTNFSNERKLTMFRFQEIAKPESKRSGLFIVLMMFLAFMVSGLLIGCALSAKANNGEEYIWPVPHHLNITQDFGLQFTTSEGEEIYHNAIDISDTNIEGAKVVAIKDGTVIYIGKGEPGQGFGNYIVIEHANKITSLYGHLDSVDVEIGDECKLGQEIGTVGKTGFAPSPNLHFQMQKGKDILNPNDYVSNN